MPASRVSTEAFRKRAEEIAKRDLKGFFTTWLTETGLPGDPGGGFWSIDSFEAEPEKALIVYGTVKEADAQREAAEHLQRGIASRWYNLTVPIKSDNEVSDADLASHHILLIGRPDSNAVAARLAASLPVKFAAASFVCRDETYAHPATAVIAAGSNPLDRRYEVVLFAGLSGEATWRCAQQVGDRGSPPAEVWLSAVGVEAARPGRHSGRGRERSAEDRSRGTLTDVARGATRAAALDRLELQVYQFEWSSEGRSIMSTSHAIADDRLSRQRRAADVRQHVAVPMDRDAGRRPRSASAVTPMSLSRATSLVSRIEGDNRRTSAHDR